MTDPTTSDHLRYRAIFESALDLAIIATDRDGRVTDWNTGAECILGWSAEAMRGEPVDCFFTPEDRAEDRPGVEMRCALETGRATHERWHVRRDGSRFWASGEIMPLRNQDGAHLGYLKILRDQTGQRQAGEAVRKIEARFRATFEQAAVGLAHVDLEGRWLRVNARLCAMLGYTEAELLTLNFQALTHPDDLQANLDHIRALVTGEVATYSMEKRYVRKDGTLFWINLTVSLLHDADGTPLHFISVIEDIFARKAAEKALRESEARYRSLFENMDAGFCIIEVRFDGTGRCVDYRFLETNPAFERQTGLADAQGKWMRKLAPAHEQHWFDLYGQVALTGIPAWLEDRAAAFGNRWFDVRAFRVGEPEARHVAILFNDISQRRHVEQALQHLNETLERQVEARTRERDRVWRLSQDLLVVADADGTLLATNAAWAALLGWEESELVGARFMQFVHPDDLDATLAAFAGIFEAPLTEAYEYRFRHTDGSYRWFAWTGAFEDGKVYATGRNTTEAHENAAALAAAEEQLRQSQKMEAVGQLTGGLAHDFNNLLTGIMGSLELLQTRIAQGRISDVDRYVTVAQGAAKRAAALTHRLLAFSRRQTLDPKLTDVNRLVSGMEELIRRTVGPSIAVEVVAAGGLWTTLIDPGQLENALLNLTINARDALPDGGRLTIETGNRWLDQRAARERDLPPGQYVALCVSDNGLGMTPDIIARAFDPFFTTKPIGMGTGLGLSMVYGFARQSGGQVRIYSEPSQGTMVCLYLPRHHGQESDVDAQANAIAAALPRDGERQGRAVLVVDDEPSVRMLVAEVLEELGYVAIEAEDGAAGLRVLESATRLDLLITDVGLPGGMNGRQVADAARAVRPGLKVLFITGYAENAVIGNGYLEPGMQVLTKPFAMEALGSRITALVSGT